jgi:SAM-dependent methyltransferase
MVKKPNYGIDAPIVVGSLLLAGAGFLAIALKLPRVTIGHTQFLLFPGFLWPAAWCFLTGGLMVSYSKSGKLRHRDRMLDKVQWTGTEAVLDVGTGRGLLLIGAAKRITSGHVTGIDIWSSKDLSGNGPKALMANVELEGVGDRANALSEDARNLSTPDASFEVVLSNTCLHNIGEPAGRAKACAEIARVLKPGGVAVISDYKLMREYEAEFKKCGLVVEMCPLDWTGTFPPMRILVARKPSPKQQTAPKLQPQPAPKPQQQPAQKQRPGKPTRNR